MTSLSSDAFDFNYGVCVMRMREGLNISEVMQAHSEYPPSRHPCHRQNRIPGSARTHFFPQVVQGGQGEISKE